MPWVRALSAVDAIRRLADSAASLVLRATANGPTRHREHCASSSHHSGFVVDVWRGGGRQDRSRSHECRARGSHQRWSRRGFEPRLPVSHLTHYRRGVRVGRIPFRHLHNAGLSPTRAQLVAVPSAPFSPRGAPRPGLPFPHALCLPVQSSRLNRTLESRGIEPRSVISRRLLLSLPGFCQWCIPASPVPFCARLRLHRNSVGCGCLTSLGYTTHEDGEPESRTRSNTDGRACRRYTCSPNGISGRPLATDR